MPTTDSSQEQATGSATPSFAEQYARYARESADLMQQISAKAPQLATVLEQLNEGCNSRRIELASPVQAPDRRRLLAARGPRGSLLDTAAGLLSHAFPGVAPLFHGCRAFLQLKMIKNNRQA